MRHWLVSLSARDQLAFLPFFRAVPCPSPVRLIGSVLPCCPTALRLNPGAGTPSFEFFQRSAEQQQSGEACSAERQHRGAATPGHSCGGRLLPLLLFARRCRGRRRATAIPPRLLFCHPQRRRTLGRVDLQGGRDGKAMLWRSAPNRKIRWGPCKNHARAGRASRQWAGSSPGAWASHLCDALEHLRLFWFVLLQLLPHQGLHRGRCQGREGRWRRRVRCTAGVGRQQVGQGTAGRRQGAACHRASDFRTAHTTSHTRLNLLH